MAPHLRAKVDDFPRPPHPTSCPTPIPSSHRNRRPVDGAAAQEGARGARGEMGEARPERLQQVRKQPRVSLIRSKKTTRAPVGASTPVWPGRLDTVATSHLRHVGVPSLSSRLRPSKPYTRPRSPNIRTNTSIIWTTGPTGPPASTTSARRGNTMARRAPARRPAEGRRATTGRRTNGGRTPAPKTRSSAVTVAGVHARTTRVEGFRTQQLKRALTTAQDTARQ